MIDYAQIIGFEWDAGNARKSANKHSFSKSEAEQLFFNQPLLILNEQKHSQDEVRFHVLGKTDGTRLLHITFNPRSADTLIRVISARDMHRKERIVYEQSQKNTDI